MELSFENRGDFLQIRIIGRLDTVSSQDFMSGLESGLNDDIKDVEIDCTELDYISSSGLRCLMTIYKKIMPRGGSLTLKGLTPQVREVLDITGMAGLFTIA